MDPISGLFAFLGNLFGGGGAAAAGAGGAAGAGAGATAGAGAGAAGAAGAGGAASAGGAAAGASPGLLGTLNAAKDAAIGGGVIQGIKTLLPKSSEEAMAAIKDKSGFGSLEKTYTTITDPKMDFRGKFDVLAPEAYKRSMENQAMFGQLQQQSQPMQMPSYARPSMPYQGGGIEEILQRQRGLLR